MKKNRLVSAAALGSLVLFLGVFAFPGVNPVFAADRETHTVLGEFGSTST